MSLAVETGRSDIATKCTKCMQMISLKLSRGNGNNTEGKELSNAIRGETDPIAKVLSSGDGLRNDLTEAPQSLLW